MKIQKKNDRLQLNKYLRLGGTSYFGVRHYLKEGKKMNTTIVYNHIIIMDRIVHARTYKRVWPAARFVPLLRAVQPST